MPVSISCHRDEYVFGLTTHSPAEFMVPVTFGSYNQVWMLRPPTALFRTVTLPLKYGENWEPHPAGHAAPPDGLAMVESPASHTVTPAGAGDADDGGGHALGSGPGSSSR